ncbi:MAG: hypothetical protein Q9162_002626 [Coniocarpon cinnabarinum]
MDAEENVSMGSRSSSADRVSSVSERDSSTSSIRGRRATPSLESTVPTKRSRTRSGSRRDLKRHRANYRNEYRLILNEEIVEAAKPFALDRHTDETEFPRAQVGLTYWTSQDKSRLYTALQRYGRHDIRKIANATHIKSELEVQQYLQLLSQGLREQHEHYRRETILRYAEIPTAAEVSADCCKQLEEAGDALGILRDGNDTQTEKAKWGRFWKLTQDVAWEIEDRAICPKDTEGQFSHSANETKHSYAVSDMKEPNWEKLSPAVSFLDTPIWLEISERIFMNEPSARVQKDLADAGSPRNWLEVPPAEPPSILTTTLTDFYNVAITLTKRLAYAAHFQALSRLRATDTPSSHRRERSVAIKKRDVQIAVDILGLKHNTREFWATAPRRHGLDVYDVRIDDRWAPVYERRKLKNRMSYDEVERRLRLSKAEELAERKQRKSKPPAPLEQHSDNEQRQMDELSDLSDADIDTRDLPASTPQDDLAMQHEAVADHLDNQQSAEEEARLWQDVLDQPIPPHLSTALDRMTTEESEKRPPIQRKQEHDLKDWRDSTVYQAPWELFGHVFDFEKARAKLERRAMKRRKLRLEREQLDDVDVEMTDREASEGFEGSDEDEASSDKSSEGDTENDENDIEDSNGSTSEDDRSSAASASSTNASDSRSSTANSSEPSDGNDAVLRTSGRSTRSASNDVESDDPSTTSSHADNVDHNVITASESENESETESSSGSDDDESNEDEVDGEDDENEDDDNSEGEE